MTLHYLICQRRIERKAIGCISYTCALWEMRDVGVRNLSSWLRQDALGQAP